MPGVSRIYVILGDGQTMPMTQVRCKDEDKELQRLLAHNPDLLPGDQIRPDDPCRWLLIKREMPVQDPNSGGDRWSVDFFFVDQSAIPTFVECKRFFDTRSRREVIGQMLEYAANGHYYWTRDTIRTFAEDTAKRRGLELATVLQQFQPDGGQDISDFFGRIEANLREGQLRLIFFLEEAPQELKSIVEFLNRQMERSEVLIVEAKQFEQEGIRVVAPSLFGFTEQARLVKKTITISTEGRAPRVWDETIFFDELRKNVSETDVAAIEQFYRYCGTSGYTIRWGKGQQIGSYNIVVPRLTSRSLIQITSNGDLYLNFGWMRDSADLQQAQEKLAELVVSDLTIKLPHNFKEKSPIFKSSLWTPKEPAFEHIFETVFSQYK